VADGWRGAGGGKGCLGEEEVCRKGNEEVGAKRWERSCEKEGWGGLGKEAKRGWGSKREAKGKREAFSRAVN